MTVLSRPSLYARAVQASADIALPRVEARSRGRVAGWPLTLLAGLAAALPIVVSMARALSELESRVLSLYLDGRSYEEVGERLGCDTKTVDNALQRVKRKVGTHLRARLVTT